MRTLWFAHNQSEMVAGHGNASVPQKMGEMLEAAKIVTPDTIQQRIVVETEMAKKWSMDRRSCQPTRCIDEPLND